MFSIFKRRDAAVYPSDEIGDALYKHCSDPTSLPDRVSLWYDAYFDTEADADSFSKYLHDRRIEVVRDYDEEPDEGYGRWNVDWEFPVRARHLDMKMAHEDMLRAIASDHGKLGSWLLLGWDDDDAD
ncbi:MAG: hypothetical protein AB7E80_06660 [Hyphomicrobiaceae bacterium]